MKIKVYQIDTEKDKNKIAFMAYDQLIKRGYNVDPTIYKTVFDGNVDCSNLEEVFALFNIAHPVGHRGHSLSISDIVEIIEDEKSACHYCDIFGFKLLKDFNSSKVAPITGGKRMVVLEPHKPAYEAYIDDSLEGLQQAVGGWIECTYPFDDNVYLIGNEEAKLEGLSGNRKINGSVYAGNLLIAADDGGGETINLTDKQVEKYLKMFAVPEDISDDEVQADMGFTIFGF